MTASNERPPEPENQAAELAGLSPVRLAGETADAISGFTNLRGLNPEQTVAAGLEFLLTANVEGLERGGYGDLALLVTECRLRFSRQTEGEQQERGFGNG
jgi:hypothetical protein